MIRIIKHGRIIERENDRKTKCNKCGCVFRFDKADAGIRCETVGLGELADHYYYTHCPDCGHDVYLGSW